MCSYNEFSYLIANIVTTNIKLLENETVSNDVKKLVLRENNELAKMMLASTAADITTTTTNEE